MKKSTITILCLASLFTSVSIFSQDQNFYEFLNRQWTLASNVISSMPLSKEANLKCIGVHRKQSATGKSWNSADYYKFETNISELTDKLKTLPPRWSSKFKSLKEADSFMIKVSKKQEALNWSRGRSYETYYYFCSCDQSRLILVRDIGVMGLASHDLFTWNKETLENDENGRLDLSTIFDYGNGALWEEGGNKKNSENAPVYTITMKLVNLYKKRLKIHGDKVKARKEVVTFFIKQVKESYQRLTSLSFPKTGLDLDVTNTEQATMRALHDILPGKIKSFDRFARTNITLTYLWNAKIKLNHKELNQVIPYFNGDYDSQYLQIAVPFKMINLKEIDAKFISEFSPYNQSEMLEELKRVGSGEMQMSDVTFIKHMNELFSKAICSKGNQWMPEVECL